MIIQSLETLDGGKPYHDSYADVEHAIDVYKYYGGLADKIGGKTIAPGNIEDFLKSPVQSVVQSVSQRLTSYDVYYDKSRFNEKSQICFPDKMRII